MSKVLKGFLIAGCVCIILGIAVLVGVVASGGSAVVRDVIESGGVGWDASGFHVGASRVWNYEDNGAQLSAIDKEYTFSADDIENLDIELAAGSFKIMEGDGKEIIIRSSKGVEVSDSGNAVSIETPNHHRIFKVGETEGQRVEITLPKGHEFHTIDLEVGAGELTVDSLLAEKITLELGAGRIEVDNFLSETAVISVGAGEVIVDNGIAKDMDLDVGMGDFWFNGSVSGDLDADCGMGNMDITLTGQESDYDYQIDCGMGEVSIGNSSFGGMSSSKEIDNDAEAEFDLECGMGSINIKFKN